VEDLAAGIILIVEQKATGIYHISGNDKLTPFNMACHVADHLHLDKTLLKKVTEKDFSQPARRPLRTTFNINKAVQQLGYTPTPFMVGLQKTFD
jgi:dTDP-4-dehydrorhamnose reductase